MIISTSRPTPARRAKPWNVWWSHGLRVSLLLLMHAVTLPAWANQRTSAAMALREVVACQATNGQIIQTSIFSSVYDAATRISVYLPPCYASETQILPVIYLLHGANADETQWPDLRVQAAADALIANGATPFIVVMPGGTYTQAHDYTAFILTDLLPAIAQQFRVSTARSGQAIGGISRGGEYALRIAFGHPDLFVAAGGHSPVVQSGSDSNLITVAQTAPGIAGLSVLLDVGAADSLQTDTATLAHVVRDRGGAVRFRVGVGGHNRAYWRANTATYLRLYMTAFATPVTPPTIYTPARC